MDFFSVHIRKKYLYMTMMAGLIVIYFLIFNEMVDELKEGELIEFDKSVIESIQSPFSEEFTKMATKITFFGSVIWIVTLVSIFSLFLFLLSKKHYALYLILTSALGGGFNWGLKYLFQRERPDIAPLLSVSGYSFPSGHSMASVILYGSIAVVCIRLIKNKYINGLIWLLAFISSLTIGWSRIYLGVHYPSDVVAGFVAGAAWLTISAWMLRYLEYKVPKKYRRE
ncbi:phosphatase PAP2 family protein [Peribacillus sp. NPDC097295]|uniref:phosphatase PAP2 family protein n=1 Tax=Peribacillus sp. NPDC097295 TaxID=3364402 RepID=UPI00382B6B08